MIYIVCTRDCKDWAWGDTVARYRDDQYEQARKHLHRLVNFYGPCFALRDH